MGVWLESTNGLAGTGQSTPYRADETRAFLPAVQQAHDREQDYAACIREAPA